MDHSRENHPETHDGNAVSSISTPQSAYYKDTCLWLIDGSDSMHTIDPESGKSFVHRAIEVAVKMMEHKLVKSPSDKIGILLYNTKETHVPVEGRKMTYPNCYCVAPIEQVNVGRTSELIQELRESEQSPDYFRQKYLNDENQIRIHYALGNAESMLNSAGKTGSRRIFFVTAIDDPYNGRSAKEKLQRNALEKIKDMRRRGIEFEAFFITLPNSPAFNTDAFYADLFQAYNDEGENLRSEMTLGGGNDPSTSVRTSWNAFEKFEDLEKDAGARETPKRVIYRLGLEVAEGLTIGVAGYNLVVRANKGNPVKCYRSDEDDPWEEVVTTSHMQCKDTGKLLNPATDVHHAFALGSDTTARSIVRFTPEEINTLKTSGLKPCIKILGFKDRSTLRFWENVKHSSFIFPTEAEYLGSQRAFSALLKAMVAKNKIAIAIFMARPTSIPDFVAILPQAEERSPEGTQLEPPGMNLVFLPFADDIREMPEAFARTQQASDEHVTAAGRFIKAYTRNAAFNPDFYPSPSLEFHYARLKAIALNDIAFDEALRNLSDKTMPDYEGIDARAGQFIRAWDELITRDAKAVRAELNATGAPGGRDGASSNTTRVSDKKRPYVYDDKEEERLVRLHLDGELTEGKGKKVTVEVLKAACEHYRLSKSGRKEEILDRLVPHLDKVVAKRGRQQENAAQR